MDGVWKIITKFSLESLKGRDHSEDLDVDGNIKALTVSHHQGDEYAAREKVYWDIAEYTAEHPRRHSSSYSPPWEPKISR
jgi:hypothetical protein